MEDFKNSFFSPLWLWGQSLFYLKGPPTVTMVLRNTALKLLADNGVNGPFCKRYISKGPHNFV